MFILSNMFFRKNPKERFTSFKSRQWKHRFLLCLCTSIVVIYFVVQKTKNLWVIGKKRQVENGSGITASRIKAELSKRHRSEMPEQGQGTEQSIWDSWVRFPRAENNTECLDNENEWGLLELGFPTSHVPTAAQGVPLIGGEVDLYHLII